jgi:hypothetical protein
MINPRLLSKKERVAFHALTAIKGETVIHYAVTKTLTTGTNEQFVRMCSQLQSQAWDNLKMMKQIIGEEAFNAVMSLNFPDCLVQKNYEMIKYNIQSDRGTEQLTQTQLRLNTCSRMIKERIEPFDAEKANELHGLILMRNIELMLRRYPVTE